MTTWPPFLAPLLTGLLVAIFAAMVTAWLWLVAQARRGRTLLGPPVVRPVPWGAGTVAACVFAFLLLNIVVPLGYRVVTDRPHGVPLSVTELMFLVTVVNALAVLVLPAVLRLVSRATPSDLGIDGSNLARPALVGALAFLIATWPVNLLHALCVLASPVHNKHPLEEMVRGGLKPDVAYLAVLSAVVFAPAVEELLFRGIVQSWLAAVFRRVAKARAAESIQEWAEDIPGAGPPPSLSAGKTRSFEWVPIVITSYVFALAHAGQWPAPIPIFVLSLVLGFIYQRTGSLVASFVLHALFNGFSTLLLFFALLHGDTQAAKAVPPPETTIALPSTPGNGDVWPTVQIPRTRIR